MRVQNTTEDDKDDDDGNVNGADLKKIWIQVVTKASFSLMLVSYKFRVWSLDMI